jgi:curved DNA-binding protein CbpA
LKNFYDMLSLRADAPADEIKKAFRREIARYHPDKVQHLGQEFQEMASGIAADLTEAYRILMDPALRAKYNQDLLGNEATTAEPAAAPSAPPPAAEPSHPPPPPPASPDPSAPASSSTSSSAASSPEVKAPRSTAGIDFVKRATLSKIREAIADVLGNSQALPTAGFDIALVTKPKKSMFKKAEDSHCLLIKFVPAVDSEAITEVWPIAVRVKATGAAGCVVMLIGPGMAPAKDLAGAISELRRSSRGLGPVIVPVDVRDWEALFPPDTPGLVRSLIQRLKEETR